MGHEYRPVCSGRSVRRLRVPSAPRRRRPLRPLRRRVRPRDADLRPAAARRRVPPGAGRPAVPARNSTYYLREFVGRPSRLYFARRLTEKLGGAKIYLKREDLNHTGAHKINNTIGQALLTLRMGKKRVIAETGAGQHGVATATAAALFGLKCDVYMGAEDIRRQNLNVFRMKLMGANVIEVHQRRQDAQGRHQRGDARLDGQRRADALHHRLGRRAAPVPDDRARLPVDDRPRGARSSAWTSKAGCRTTSSPASAAAPTPPGSSPRSPTTPR